MAEVIGIVAASAQFAELLAKVAVRGAKLVSDLKHAPEEVKQKAQALDDFQALYGSIEDVINQHAASLGGVSVKREDFDHVHALIARADEESASLEALVDRLKPNATDKRLDAWRKAAKTLLNRSDIAAHLDALRDVKKQLDSFFSRSTFGHLVHHSAKVDTTLDTLTKEQARNLQTLSHIEKRQITDGHTLVSVETAVTAVGDAHRAFSEENRQMHQSLQEGIGSLHQQSAEVGEAVMRNSSETIDQINSRFDQLHAILTGLKLSEEPVRSSAREMTIHSKQETDGPPRCLAVSRPPITGLSSICPCQRKGIKEVILNIGPVSVVRRQFGKHFPACPFSEHGNSSNIVTSVSPELSDTFRQNLTVSTSWYAETATSFLRGVLHLPRIVDDKDPNAPGFKHFRKAFRLLSEAFANGRARHPGECSQVLTELYESLAYDFNTTRDWANIESHEGHTLLHELQALLARLHHADDNMSYILDKIIQLLVDGGTPVDAVGRKGYYWLSMATAFDVYILYRILYAENSDFAQEQGCTTVMQVLRRNGLSTMGLRPWAADPYGFSSVLSFYWLPDLAIEHGCSSVTYAVLTKDEGRLRHLLETGHSSNGNRSDPNLPPLCFAHSWSTGAQILLEANAQPEAAVVVALHYQLSGFLETLLKHDMWLNEPSRGLQGGILHDAWDMFSIFRITGDNKVDTLAQYAMLKNGATTTSFSILRATANARSELMRLATHHLSSSQLQDLGWTPANYTGCLIESAAIATYEKLRSMGVELKKSHFPGLCTNLYDYLKLDLEMADFLWDCGFRELDVPVQHGATPLLLHAPVTKHSSGRLTSNMIDLSLWFLDHGASKCTYPELNHTTFPHRVTAALGSHLVGHWESACDTYNAGDVGEILQRLPQVLEHPTVVPLLPSRDHCDCACSGGAGCSPITSFTKAARFCHQRSECDTGTSCRANRDIIFLWKRYGPLMGCAGCADFMDLCRVELFERLGMRHTCCFFGSLQGEYPQGYENVRVVGYYDVYGFHPVEAAEFREEDRFFRQKLEALMALYEDLSAQYDDGGHAPYEDWEKGAFRAFWDTWWKVLQEYLPEDDSSEMVWELDEIPVEASTELSTDEIVEAVRRRVQRSMVLDGF